MRKRKIYRAYQEAKYHSTERGIPFYFTFKQWTAKWRDDVGRDWFRKRGRRKGQYVMARFGDAGPYAPWNVECILCEQNHHTRKVNGVSTAGSKHWQAKITEQQAKEIYFAIGSERQIGKKYGINGATVGDIKRRKTWAHVTNRFGPAPRQPAARR